MKNLLKTRRERKEEQKKFWADWHEKNREIRKEMVKIDAQIRIDTRDWKQKPIIERLDKIISLLEETEK